jgi:DNA-binding IscR family transcriptional regulator
LPGFVDIALREIDDQLHALKDESTRLKAARAALTGRRERRDRPASGVARQKSAGARGQRNGRVPARQARGNGGTRANQALELVRRQPGITIPQIAQAMNIQSNYLYRVLARLASAGEITRHGQGWHPAPSSTSTNATPARTTRRPRRSRAARSQATISTRATARSQRSPQPTSITGSRTARGATTASVLAALAGGGAMTASQVAAKAGLARPTVSTTLSNLAKRGEVQKAERGYRLTTAA